MELETVNKLFLELSQFATATTAREIALAKELAEVKTQRDDLIADLAKAKVSDDVVLMPKIPTPEIIAAGWFDGDVTVALGHAQAYAESERCYISMLAAQQKEAPSC